MVGLTLAALTACWIAASCESSGGGGDCFPPEHGPSNPSCVGFDLGLTCPVGEAFSTCVCTATTGADAGTAQAWVCVPVVATGSGGAAGTGGSPGAGGGTTGVGGTNAGSDGGSDGAGGDGGAHGDSGAMVEPRP